MSKHARVAAFVKTLEEQAGYFHPCYEGYFQCFNAGDYYEAHDVLDNASMPATIMKPTMCWSTCGWIVATRITCISKASFKLPELLCI